MKGADEEVYRRPAWDAYLCKPIDPLKLENVLCSFLGSDKPRVRLQEALLVSHDSIHWRAAELHSQGDDVYGTGHVTARMGLHP